MPLPSGPERDYLVAEIFAQSFDANGEAVGEKHLSCHGALILGDAPKWCGKWIDDEDSGTHLSYLVEQGFDIRLSPEKYPESELSIVCSPVGALERVPPVPGQEYEDVYTLRYETVRKGNCTIADREFKLSVTIQ